MPLEIERKFLVNSDRYKIGAKPVDIMQAYLIIQNHLAIRVRIEGRNASLAVKSKVSERVNREYEYNIPLDEAQSMMKLSEHSIITKTRYLVEFKRHTWEVDEFHGDNQGLVVAEIELDDENELFEKPDWLDNEVTSDYRYLNSNLSKSSYKTW
jgi:CYTH domain-containing protein